MCCQSRRQTAQNHAEQTIGGGQGKAIERWRRGGGEAEAHDSHVIVIATDMIITVIMMIMIMAWISVHLATNQNKTKQINGFTKKVNR